MKYLIQHSILERAQNSPDHQAFRCRDESLSYASLVDQSAKLANVLRSLGLTSMERVGIFMNKDLNVPVATNGILMAGGVYVPIDPGAPKNRIEFILRDCGISILITQASKAKMLSQIAESRETPLSCVIGVPEGSVEDLKTIPWKKVLDASASPHDIACNEDDLAYIMYTSGSTGAPKGLMHTHRSGLAYARYSAALYSVGPDDVLGNHAPLHFDISTFEFLTGPYAGATSVLIPEEEMLFPNSLCHIIERDRLTFWYSVPLALIQMLTRGSLDETDTSSLRWILFGGEPFPPKYLAQLIKLIPSARFCNVYGPAEVNQCTYYNLPSDFDERQAVPIGTVWEGAKALLLDENDRCVLDGQPGELLVSSPSMMQGYWAREDMNRTAFLEYEEVPGFTRRYYRTGDLLKRDSGGELHFLGRKDRQVKIRGYRLELDEIEAVFTSLEAVEEAAAVAVEAENGERTLVVITTLRPATEFQPKRLLSEARLKLPAYAIPSRIETRSAFPRTTSGKIDRTQLALEYKENSTLAALETRESTGSDHRPTINLMPLRAYGNGSKP